MSPTTRPRPASREPSRSRHRAIRRRRQVILPRRLQLPPRRSLARRRRRPRNQRDPRPPRSRRRSRRATPRRSPRRPVPPPKSTASLPLLVPFHDVVGDQEQRLLVLAVGEGGERLLGAGGVVLGSSLRVLDAAVPLYQQADLLELARAGRMALENVLDPVPLCGGRAL